MESDSLFFRGSDKFKKIWSYFFLVIFIVYPYIFIWTDIEFSDGFFFAGVCTIDYKYYQMTLLSNWIGHVWKFIFGDYFIGLRALSILIAQLTILTPLIILKPIKDNLFIKNILLALTVLIGYQLISWWYSADVVSNFFIVLTATFTIKYFENRKIIYLIAIALATTLATLTRFPDLLLILVFVFISFFNYFIDKKNVTKYIFLKENIIVLILSLIFFFVIIALFYQDFELYFQQFTIVKGGKHSIYELIIPAILDFGRTSVFVLFFAFTYYLYCKVSTNKVLDWIIIISIFLIIAGLMIIKYVYRIPNAFFYFAIIYLFIVNYKNNFHKNRIIITTLLSLFLFSFISAAGSNCGLEAKILTVAFFPILLPLFMHYIDAKAKLITIVLLCAMILGGVYTKTTRCYGGSEAGVFGSTSSVNTEKLKYIRVQPSKKELIEDVLLDANKIEKSGNEVIYLGANFLFLYLNNYNPIKLITYTTNYELNYPIINRYLETTKKKPHFIIVTFTERYKYNRIIDLLSTKGYYCSKLKSNYLILSPNN